MGDFRRLVVQRNHQRPDRVIVRPGVTINIADNALNRVAGSPQQVDAVRIETRTTVVNAPDELVHRTAQRRDPIDARRIDAAVQRMAGTVQCIRHANRQRIRIEVVDETANSREVPVSLLREDLQQDRVHLERRLAARHRLAGQFRGIRVAVGECHRLGRQQANVRLRLGTDLELLDQFGHRARGLGDEIHHRRRAHERPVDEPVQQVLDVPAEFADALRADHPATALQRVERAPHRDQRLHVIRIVGPQRHQFANRRDFFLGLLDEQLEQLRRRPANE